MSFVTKCDICGEIYKSSSESSSFRIDGHFVIDSENHRTDLCPKCTKNIKEFIEVLKSGYEYRVCMKHPLDGWPKEIEE